MVTIFRELRDGRHRDGKTKLKSPSGTLSTGRGDLGRDQRPGDGRVSTATASLRARRPRRRPDRRGREGSGAGPGGLAGVPARRWSRSATAGRTSTAQLQGGPLSHRSAITRLRRPPPRPGLRAQPACARWRRCNPTVLVEGPPDAAEVLALAGARRDAAAGGAARLPGRRAGSARSSIRSREFSPEWQAIRCALARGIPVRFIDLPQCAPAGAPDARSKPPRTRRADERDGRATDERRRDEIRGSIRSALLAEAAGYADRELWWDTRSSGGATPPGCSTAILEAMTRAARGASPSRPAARTCCARRTCARRSARR